MKLQYKSITNKEMKVTVIGKWHKFTDYNIYACDITNEMFKTNLILCFGDLKDFARLIKDQDEYDVEHSDALALYCWTTKNGSRSNYLFFKENNWTAENYGVICHELHHFTHLVLESIGVTYGTAGEELYAYHQGHYMEYVIRALMELQKILNKRVKRLKKKK